MPVTIFNSQDTFYKTPFGAVRAGETVAFTLTVPVEFGCTTPYLLFNRDGEQPSLFPLQKQYFRNGMDVFSTTIQPQEPGLYFYYFDLYTGYRKLYAGQLGEAYVTTGDGEAWQLTVYEKDFQTPSHLRGGVIYQIFPDRFFESSPHATMPYADRIYRPDKRSEPYFWPNEQHEGYLNMDYYGGDLPGIRKKLTYLASLGVTCIYLNPIFEAHANHRYNTADYRKVDPVLGTNEDFAELCRAAKARGIDVVLDGVFSHTGSDSVYFNREGRYASFGAWQGPDSPYRRWYDFSPNYPHGYRCWWGFETLPEVNEEDRSYREFICGEGGVIDYWLGLGASGFRLDVADELPDDFIEEIRRAVKRHGSEKYLLGEVWEDATNKWSYGRRLMTLAYAMIFTLPGIPSIYYGDEIGMQGYKDPFNRAFFDWESRETRIRPVLQNLAALRKSCPAFADGTLAVTQAQGGVLCYERRAEAAVAAVCINRTEQQVRTVLLGRTVEVQPCSFAVVTDPE